MSAELRWLCAECSRGLEVKSKARTCACLSCGKTRLCCPESSPRQIPEDTAEHFPHLPEAGKLTSTDRICSDVFPTKRGRPGIQRVFHEAGPVAYYGSGEAVIKCIHCAREFDSLETHVVTERNRHTPLVGRHFDRIVVRCLMTDDELDVLRTRLAPGGKMELGNE